MADAEWFTVEYESGGAAANASGHWPNRETADALAAEAAGGTDQAVMVVRYQRTVVGRATRQVVVTNEDLVTATSTTSTTSPAVA